MLIKTILNRVEKFKGFVYRKTEFTVHDGRECLAVGIEPRQGSAAVCSCCHRPAPCYDRAAEPRWFEFVPLWGIAVFFVYVMRRVDCPRCGVKTEQVPWADGKHQCTKTYMQFLASWARSLSWTEVSKRFQTSWEKVFHAVEYVVEWGLQHRSLGACPLYVCAVSKHVADRAGWTPRAAKDGFRQPPALLRCPWTAQRTESAPEPASADCGRSRRCSIPPAPSRRPVAGIGGSRVPA